VELPVPPLSTVRLLGLNETLGARKSELGGVKFPPPPPPPPQAESMKIERTLTQDDDRLKIDLDIIFHVKQVHLLQA
jgi:hypothetical protein